MAIHRPGRGILHVRSRAAYAGRKRAAVRRTPAPLAGHLNLVVAHFVLSCYLFVTCSHSVVSSNSAPSLGSSLEHRIFSPIWAIPYSTVISLRNGDSNGKVNILKRLPAVFAAAP